MKKINKFFKLNIRLGIILVCMLSVSSCSEEFLELTPTTVLDKNTFYSNETELVIAVNGVYGAQRSLYGDFLFLQMKDGRSDDVYLNQLEQPERVNMEIFAETSGNQSMVTIWNKIYDIINLANAIIVNGADAEGDEVLIRRVIAEAKFIRALTYFESAVIWGGLPLRVTPSEDFDNITVATSPVDAVYNQIVKDLTEAVPDLPTSYSDGSGSEVGRVTSHAALTLLGKVELQRGDKGAAEAALRQVLGKGELLPNYADIHTGGNDNTAESIFEIQYNPSSGQGLGMPTAFIPLSETIRLGIVQTGNSNPFLRILATNDLVNSAFEAGDPRALESYTISVADGTPYISKFLDFAAIGNGHNTNLVQLRYADVLLMLAEAIGENAEAYGYINEVRNRVGLALIDGTTPGTFDEKVLRERRAEFAFEGHRWRDLLRLEGGQGTLDIMEANLLDQLGEPFSLNDSDLLFPIPQLEIDLTDGAVTQNPGY